MCVYIHDTGSASTYHLQVYVFGLCGSTYTVKSTAEFAALIKLRGLATTLYQYTLVPLVHGAPHIPLCAWCHDGSLASFTSDQVQESWRYMWQVGTSTHFAPRQTHVAQCIPAWLAAIAT